MLTPRSRRLSLLLLPLLCLAAPACEDDEDSEIGTPCEQPSDCSDDLICDVHDGKGTCQHEHGHQVPDDEPEAKFHTAR